MKIYIDNDFKCHAAPGEGLREAESPFFDGKCRRFIEGYRYVPEGETWVREDGVVFTGEMIAPHEDYAVLAAAQQQYEETAAEVMAELNAAYAEGVNSI